MTDFHDAMQKLIDQSEGSVVGSVVVDQVYAHYQEANPQFHHPDGGQAYYLRDSLYDNINDKLQKIADKTLDDEGTHPENGMKDVVDDIKDGVTLRAPLEFGDLKGSAARTVTVGQETVYDVPAAIHRLSKEELKDKGKLSRLLDPYRYSK